MEAQNTFRAIILDKEEKEPLTGVVASLKGTINGVSSDKEGKIILNNIPNGKQIGHFSRKKIQSLQYICECRELSGHPAIALSVYVRRYNSESSILRNLGAYRWFYFQRRV